MKNRHILFYLILILLIISGEALAAVGDTKTIGGETFYVVSESTYTYVAIAKYPINSSLNQQNGTTYKTNWSNAKSVAARYGAAKGYPGRLCSHNREVQALANSDWDRLKIGSNPGRWWLQELDPSESGYAWCVRPPNHWNDTFGYWEVNDNEPGPWFYDESDGVNDDKFVRPVLVVCKSHNFVWKQSSSQHWQECTRCGATQKRGDHTDNRDRDGYCDTCNYHMYIKVTYPTLTNGTFTYDSESHSPALSGFDSTSTNITGNTAIDAGSYTYTLSLKSHTPPYVWKDLYEASNSSPSQNRTGSWTINKKVISIVWLEPFEYEVDGREWIPSVAQMTGTPKETLTFTPITKTKYLGTYTASVPESQITVSGGQGKYQNYTITAESKTHSFKLIDTIAPTITATPYIDGTTNVINVWTNQNVRVKLAAHDKYNGGSKTGSGVHTIQNTLDNGTWNNLVRDANKDVYELTGEVLYAPANNTFLEHTYSYRCYDKASNYSPIVKVDIKIDKIKPSISIVKDPNNDHWVNGNKKFTITVSDGNAGLDKLEFKEGNGNWQSLATDINTVGRNEVYTKTYSQDIDTTVTFRVWDKAGNSNQLGPYVVKVDKSKPQFTITKTNIQKTGSDFGVEDDWTNGKVRFDFVCSDSWSGIAKVQYKRIAGTNLDNDWVNIYNDTSYNVSTHPNLEKSLNTYVEFPDEQETQVKFRIIDNVGVNGPLITESATYDIKIDHTPPTISFDFDPKVWTNQDVTMIFNTKDKSPAVASSGVSVLATKYTWDGRNVTNFQNVEVDGSKRLEVIGRINQPTNIWNGVLVIYDRAGNKATATKTILNIDKVAPTITQTTDGSTRYQTFTITDPNEDTNRVPYGQSMLYGFGAVDNEITVLRDADVTPGVDYDESTNWVGTVRNEKWYRLPNIDTLPIVENTRPANAKTKTASVQFFFEKEGTYYFKVRDVANNITTKTVTITFKPITEPMVTVTSLDPATGEDFVYDGNPKQAVVVVKDGDKDLVENEDYKLEYNNNVNAGENTATVTVTGIGDYKGTVTLPYSIKKRDLVITPNKDQWKMVGDSDPDFTFSVANYVRGEVPAFNGKLSRDSAGNNEPGLYKITLGNLSLKDNGRFLASNYKIVFNNPYSRQPEAEPYPNPKPDLNEEIKFRVDDFDAFTTVWKTTSANTEIKLPIPANVKNSFRVTWGDGTSDVYRVVDFPTHTYATPGEYTVRISGTVVSFGYYGEEQPTATNSFSDYLTFNQYLIRIVKYGNINVERMGYSYCTKLLGDNGTNKLPPITGFDKVRVLDNMFNNCTSITTIPTGYFKDMSMIRTVRNIFKNDTGITTSPEATLFQGCSSITSFEGAFEGCRNIGGVIPGDMFNTNTNVVTFARVYKDTKVNGTLNENLFANNIKAQSFAQSFEGCTSITAIPEKLFSNNEQGTNFYQTFAGCTGLTTVPKDLFNHDTVGYISNEPTSLNDYHGTFKNCTGLTGDLELNITLVGRSMFEGCGNIKSLTLNKTGEIGERAYWANNKLTHINVSRNNLSLIDKDAFEFTGTPRPLTTYVNRNNRVLVEYDWDDDNRYVDLTPPRGTVRIIRPETYPFTKTENVKLDITADDPDCYIAIINDVTYDTLVKDNEAMIAEYEAARAAGQDVTYPTLFEFDWQKLNTYNGDWTLSTVEGIKTVYVYFKDEMGNMSNVAIDF